MDEICELVMDLEYKRWQIKQQEDGDVASKKPFPRVPRVKLIALSDKLGLRLRNVERRFERKWLALIMSGGGRTPSSGRRK